MKNLETASDTKMYSVAIVNTPSPNIDMGTAYACELEDSISAAPRMHYFIAYQFRLNGNWYATNLYLNRDEAKAAASDKAIVRKKVCAIWL